MNEWVMFEVKREEKEELKSNECEGEMLNPLNIQIIVLKINHRLIFSL